MAPRAPRLPPLAAGAPAAAPPALGPAPAPAAPLALSATALRGPAEAAAAVSGAAGAIRTSSTSPPTVSRSPERRSAGESLGISSPFRRVPFLDRSVYQMEPHSEANWEGWRGEEPQTCGFVNSSGVAAAGAGGAHLAVPRRHRAVSAEAGASWRDKVGLRGAPHLHMHRDRLTPAAHQATLASLHDAPCTCRRGTALGRAAAPTPPATPAQGTPLRRSTPRRLQCPALQ